MDRNTRPPTWRALARVASREGGVDRNPAPCPCRSAGSVASREGGVDRNVSSLLIRRIGRVASREGGVDRNLFGDPEREPDLSPPARGAWIATLHVPALAFDAWVASREGGVDRNIGAIRITRPIRVASREGGVDRNRVRFEALEDVGRRLPRGGRGSQRQLDPGVQPEEVSPPARGAWIATSVPVAVRVGRLVASREGGVDRNSTTKNQGPISLVASREGGVDRNVIRPGRRRR